MEKKRRRRFIIQRVTAAVLAVCLAAGMVLFTEPLEVKAMTRSEFDSKLSSIENRFPSGSKYDDRLYNKGIQCFGYAHWAANQIFGGDSYNWAKVYNMNNVKAGDIIQYGNPRNGGHTIFVTAVSGNTITYTDANSDSHNTVRWRQTTQKNAVLDGRTFNYLQSGPGVSEGMPPTVSDGQIIGVDEGGYMIQCRVTGPAISSVKVASWVDGNGQGDLKWGDMVRQADGVTYKYYVTYSDHGNIAGNYQNHIYAYNLAGKGVQSVYFCAGDKPEISDIHIADADSDGYTIECKIDSYNMLSGAQVATWTTINGQDDLQWKDLERQPDGLTYKSYIPYSSHNNEKGSYENLIYAKSITGEESQMITHCNELHNWNAGSVLKEAKCDETGLKEYTCTACNATKREEIPAAHNEDSGTVTKQPTETETGIRTYKCSICQRELRTEEIAKLPPSHTHDYEASAWRSDAETHWKECECGERSENAAHQFSWVIDIAATEDSTGLKHEECETCGYGRSMGTIIEQLNAADNIALSKTSCTYNGKTQKPSVTVKDSSGKTLKNNVDYTVSFPKGMKNVGRYIITVTLKGNYSGTISETFDIVPKGTSISKVTAKKKGFTVKWKKQKKQTTGYEIAYSTSSKFAKKSTKITDAGKSRAASKTVSNLKAKKKYYVRIRTYKTVKISGKSVKLYSDWSKAKAVTTKK